ncbi:unnamed protein product [Sphagnum balticum]
MANSTEKDMAIEGGGDVKSKTTSDNDKEDDISKFVDDEPTRGPTRPTKKRKAIVESNVGEEINFEDLLAQQKVAKRQTSKEYAKVKSIITKSTSFVKMKKSMKAPIVGRVSIAKTTQHASKIMTHHTDVK